MIFTKSSRLLGVCILNQDCGERCKTGANNGLYFACDGTKCAGTTTTVQVQNPVTLLPTDNNGVVLSFPNISTSGATSLTGSLILGIGAQPNNTPAGVTTLLADAMGSISTVFAASGSTAWSSYLDSGTPVLVLPPTSTLTACGTHSPVAGYLCPPTVQTATATNFDAKSAISSKVTFQVGNAETLAGSPNMVFGDVAMVMPGQVSNGVGGDICWGLPFYMGRSVYSGIEGKSSLLGSGMYYAY